MSKLNEYLDDIDSIEVDEEFCEMESEKVYEYCEALNFQLSDDDMQTIVSRGLEDSFEFWKNNRD